MLGMSAGPRVHSFKPRVPDSVVESVPVGMDDNIAVGGQSAVPRLRNRHQRVGTSGGIVLSNPNCDTWKHEPFRTTQPADIHRKLVRPPGYVVPLHRPPMRDPGLPFGTPTAVSRMGCSQVIGQPPT